MTDDGTGQSPAWWIVDRRTAREAERQARRDERAARREGRETRRGVRRGAAREPMTPERIADAALAIIDAQGVDGLTVRTLADALGVGTMTLYWYVRNKDEVLELLADRLLAGVIPPGADGDWQDAVRSMASGVRQALLRHPRAVPLLASRGSLGPSGLALAEASLAALEAAGFRPDEAAGAYLTVSVYVTGFCLWETGIGAASATAGQSASTANRAPLLPPERYPHVVASAPWLSFGRASDERFAFGIEVIIAGLSARHDRADGSTPGPPPR